jgi:HlyD family secretion protein
MNTSIQLWAKPSNRQLVALVVGLALLTVGVSYYGISHFAQSDQQSAAQKQAIPAAPQVVALGQVEPQTEVIKVSVPAALSNDRVAQLLVQRGDRVTQGQVVAVLDSHDRLQGLLAEARSQVSLAQAELAQVKAGAKSGEIAAQTSEIERLKSQRQGDVIAQRETVARLEAQLAGDRMAQMATIRRLTSALQNVDAEYQRYQKLYTAGGISQSLRDSKRLAADTTREEVTEAKIVLERINGTAARQLSEARAVLTRAEETGGSQIDEAKANLDRIAEVRPVDVQTAQAKVNQAQAGAQRAEAELAQATVRSPVTGRILEIFAKPGEVVRDNGLLSLGQTEQMQVVAEVYQSEIQKVRQGQSATITSEVFGEELRGTVHEIGMEVSRQSTFSNQPGENLDQRIVKVRIRINPEDSQRIAGLTNLQVQVAIALEEGT